MLSIIKFRLIYIHEYQQYAYPADCVQYLILHDCTCMWKADEARAAAYSSTSTQHILCQECSNSGQHARTQPHAF